MTEPRFAFATFDPADEARIRALWGRPPINLYRILAHHPRILRAWTDWNNELRHGCDLPRSLRELIFLRSALLQSSDYEWTQHLRMARSAGVPEAQIADLVDWEGSDAFDRAERIVLAATDELTRGGLSDGTFGELRLAFSTAETLEIIITASHAAMLGRVIQAIAVTDHGELSAAAEL